MSTRDSDDREILILEYQTRISQFQFLMEQRAKIFEWYAKVVLIPAAAVSYVGFLRKSEENVQGSFGLGMLLLGVFAVGGFMFMYYCAETVNSSLIASKVTGLRRALGNLCRSPGSLFQKEERSPRKFAPPYVPFFRGMAFGVMNSLIFGMAICLMSNGSRILSLAAFTIGIGFHYYFYQKLLPEVRYKRIVQVAREALRR